MHLLFFKSSCPSTTKPNRLVIFTSSLNHYEIGSKLPHLLIPIRKSSSQMPNIERPATTLHSVIGPAPPIGAPHLSSRHYTILARCGCLSDSTGAPWFP